MKTIKDLINRILWDKKEDKEDYSLFYIDRITKKDVEIKGRDIKRAEGSFIIVARDGEEAEIPMHRIRAVKKKGMVVWVRGK